MLPVSPPLPVLGAGAARTPALEFVGVSISFKEAGKARFTAVENVDPRLAATLTDRISAAPALLDTLTPLIGLLLRGREAA